MPGFDRRRSKFSHCWLPLVVLTLLLFTSPSVTPRSTTYAAPTLQAHEDYAWNFAANMSSAYAGHAAVLLSDGRVLVVGGLGQSNFRRSAEIYDPTSNTWSNAADMLEPRYGHTATLLADGNVLVVGGYVDGGKNPIAEVYNPVTNLWQQAGTLRIGRAHHTATLLDDGRVLVAGGEDEHFRPSASVEIYDPTTNGWSDAGSMNEGRYQHTATRILDGRVLVAGGWFNNSAEMYDPNTNQWQQVSNLALPRSSHSAFLLNSGEVLVFGDNSYSTFGAPEFGEIYNPVTHTWRRTSNTVRPRTAHAAAMLPNGRVLAIGGFDGISSEIYDPATNTWQATDPLNVVRYSAEAVTLPDGRVLITGGSDRADLLASSEIFAPIPAPRCPTDAAAKVKASWERVARGSFRITNEDNCTAQLGSAVYAMYSEILADQVLLNDEVRLVEPGRTVTMTLSLPRCRVQLDLFVGETLPSLETQRYGSRLYTATFANGAYCGPDFWPFYSSPTPLEVADAPETLATTQATAPLEHAAPDLLVGEYAYDATNGRWAIVKSRKISTFPTGAFAWTPAVGAGTRYLTIQPLDAQGQPSGKPTTQLLNVTPPVQQSDPEHPIIYRYELVAGQRLTARTTPISGDVDLVLWAPDGSSTISNQPNGTDEVSIVAPSAGIYQLEVRAATLATYRLTMSDIMSHGVGGSSAAKPVPEAPLVALETAPAPSRRFLSFVMR